MKGDAAYNTCRRPTAPGYIVVKSIEKYILHGGILPYRIFYIVLKFATCSPTVIVAVVSRIPQSDGHLPTGFLDCQL